MYPHCLYQEWATLTSLPLIFLWLSTIGMAEILWEESTAGEKVLGLNFGAFLYVRSYGWGKKDELAKETEGRVGEARGKSGKSLLQKQRDEYVSRRVSFVGLSVAQRSYEMMTKKWPLNSVAQIWLMTLTRSVSLEKWEWKVDGSRLMSDWGMNRGTTRQLVWEVLLQLPQFPSDKCKNENGVGEGI